MPGCAPDSLASAIIDFGEQFPYHPEKAKALLKEAEFDQKDPLRYSITTHGMEAALPTIATIMQTPYAKLGVEVPVDVIDRPIYLRRLTRDHLVGQARQGAHSGIQ